jgi:hypothetical protein
MENNHLKITKENLNKLFDCPMDSVARSIPAYFSGTYLEFHAFGKICQIYYDRLLLDGIEAKGALGIIISLYALNANPDLCIIEPLKAFKDFPNSMPYAGAFATHTQDILVPMADQIEKNIDLITKKFNGSKADSLAGGDFSFVVNPLPKIFLCYIFYRKDDEFPPSVTCLYSSNALNFIPIDALADVGEYTSKEILNII